MSPLPVSFALLLSSHGHGAVNELCHALPPRCSAWTETSAFLSLYKVTVSAPSLILQLFTNSFYKQDTSHATSLWR